MADKDYTPYQQKIIKRYYDNQGTLGTQRLADLVGELYLAEGKKTGKPLPRLNLPLGAPALFSGPARLCFLC